MKKLASLFIFFSILLFLLGGYQLYLKNDQNRLKFDHYSVQPIKNQTNSQKKKFAQEIIIKDLGIDVPILPAKIINDTWETTSYGASHLVNSPLPGETGNSIIYGHNWVSIFGNLTRAKPGQKITIVSAGKPQETFTITYTSLVSPEESTILAPTNDKRITLYTCAGFLDSKRFVVVAIMD